MKRAALLLLALLLSSSCYLYGIFHNVPGKIYTGMRSINASDYNQHLSWIRQCREGHFLLRNLYTSDVQQQGALVRPIYFALSIPFAWIPISNQLVFHLLRLICGAILLLALFPLLRSYEQDSRTVQIAFVLMAFTSGAGFFLKNWLSRPADLGVPETILFLSLGEAPHFLYSLLLLWVAVTCIYVLTTGTANTTRVMSGYFLALVLIWWEHPFEAVVIVSICLATFWLIPDRRKQILVIAGTALLSVPPYLYYDHLKQLPAFSGWSSAQNLMLSPPFPALFSAFLLLAIFAIGGCWVLFQHSAKRKLLFFLTIWILLQFILAYAPFSFQRRLIAGVQFPLSLLAAYAITKLQKPILISAIILLLSVSNILSISQQIKDISSAQMPYYLPESYSEAFRWLEQQKEKQVVLSGFVTGNFIPAYTGFATYAGHSSLTPQVAKKRREIADFYKHPDPQFLKNNRIQFIFWGLEERHLSDYPLHKMFPIVYETAGVQILSATPANNVVLWAKS